MNCKTDIRECKNWLSNFLKKEKPINEVRLEAKRLNYTKGTLMAARRELGVRLVRSYRIARIGRIIDMWRLP